MNYLLNFKFESAMFFIKKELKPKKGEKSNKLKGVLEEFHRPDARCVINAMAVLIGARPISRVRLSTVPPSFVHDLKSEDVKVTISKWVITKTRLERKEKSSSGDSAGYTVDEEFCSLNYSPAFVEEVKAFTGLPFGAGIRSIRADVKYQRAFLQEEKKKAQKAELVAAGLGEEKDMTPEQVKLKKSIEKEHQDEFYKPAMTAWFESKYKPMIEKTLAKPYREKPPMTYGYYLTGSYFCGTVRVTATGLETDTRQPQGSPELTATYAGTVVVTVSEEFAERYLDAYHRWSHPATLGDGGVFEMFEPGGEVPRSADFLSRAG